jgi:hypothetical protein
MDIQIISQPFDKGPRCRITNGENREAVNRLDNVKDSTHQSAPYVHPAKAEKAQPLKVTPFSAYLVPKPGFEPGQAYTH